MRGASPRPVTIGGNWKMHLDLASALGLARDLRARVGSLRGVQLTVFPPAPFLHPVAATLRGSAIAVGAQDVHPLASGAHTSAMSAEMVRSVGATAILVGHSERRHEFGDDDARVAAKLRAVLRAGCEPVLCIGETLDDRRAGRTEPVLRAQLERALHGLGPGDCAHITVAYEPVWAIGTGVTARPDEAQAAHAFVRSWLASALSPDIAAAMPIQYGGSVKPDNAAELLACPDVDGALVGGASLDALSFARIAWAGARR